MLAGPKGALQLQLPEGVLVEQVEQEIQVKRIAIVFVRYMAWCAV
jgi:hypothetical protein